MIILHNLVVIGSFLGLLLDLLVPLRMCVHVLLLKPLGHHLSSSFDGVHLSSLTVFIDVECVTSLNTEIVEMLSIQSSVETLLILPESHLL